MSSDTVVTNERLAQVAIQNASAQPWEVRNVFAECLAHRIAANPGSSRKPALLEPAVGAEAKGA